MRIAWTLLSCGVKIKPTVLAAARDHVFLHLAPSTPLPHAEDRASDLTRQFVAQARGQVYTDPWPGDAEMPLTDRWAAAVDAIRDHVTDTVFRKHYGDGRPIDAIAAKLGVDTLAVEVARSGLREVLRRAARADGLPLDSWSGDRLDRVLVRLAGWAPDTCPPTYDVANGAHHDHVRRCPRCSRMVRLLHAGAIEVSDLQAPTLKARPRGRTSVLALHFHPDARCHRAALRDALTVDSHPVGDGVLLVDVSDPGPVARALTLAAEVGMPRREHLRGARVEGEGCWTRFGPLGPLATSAPREVRGRGWGSVDGMGALPEVIPEPPAAAGAWVLVAAMALLTSGILYYAMSLDGSGPPGPEVTFVDAHDGTWAQFDVDEPDRVHVVGWVGGAVEPVLLSETAADKGDLAIGDGSYRVHVPGNAALVVASAEPLDLRGLFPTARAAPSPLAALAAEVRRIHPSADVFLHTR